MHKTGDSSITNRKPDDNETKLHELKKRNKERDQMTSQTKLDDLKTWPGACFPNQKEDRGRRIQLRINGKKDTP